MARLAGTAPRTIQFVTTAILPAVGNMRACWKLVRHHNPSQLTHALFSTLPQASLRFSVAKGHHPVFCNRTPATRGDCLPRARRQTAGTPPILVKQRGARTDAVPVLQVASVAKRQVWSGTVVRPIGGIAGRPTPAPAMLGATLSATRKEEAISPES